jgi:hypothetical protein
LLVRPGAGVLGIVFDVPGLGDWNAEHLSVPQRALACPSVKIAGVDARDHRHLAYSPGILVKDVLQSLGQGRLTERDVDPLFAGAAQGAAPDAVLQHRETLVDHATIVHLLYVVIGEVRSDF